MRHHTKNRGLFVLVRREGDGNDRLFRWGIYRRRIPFGAKSTEGGFDSITLLILPEKRLSLNCLSRFSRKKTRRVIRTPFGAGGVVKISRSRRRLENGSPLRSRHAPGAFVFLRSEPPTFVYRPHPSIRISRCNRPQFKPDPLQIIEYI